jgi:hypothetical protein
MADDEQPLSCSFCGKPEVMVETLIQASARLDDGRSLSAYATTASQSASRSLTGIRSRQRLRPSREPSAPHPNSACPGDESLDWASELSPDPSRGNRRPVGTVGAPGVRSRSDGFVRRSATLVTRRDNRTGQIPTEHSPCRYTQEVGGSIPSPPMVDLQGLPRDWINADSLLQPICNPDIHEQSLRQRVTTRGSAGSLGESAAARGVLIRD